MLYLIDQSFGQHHPSGISICKLAATMSDRFLKFWRARLRCWHPHHLHLCQKVNITVLVFSITTIRSLFAFLVTQWHTCRNVHMHARIAKLLQRLSERFHFSAISETRDWWISTLVSCILVIVQFKYLCICSIIGTTKLTHNILDSYTYIVFQLSREPGGCYYCWSTRQQ